MNDRGSLPDVRPVEADDRDRLIAVGTAAGSLFPTVGIELPPDDFTILRGPDEAKWIRVAGRPPIGYAVLEELDGAAHLQELAVHPDHGRRGVGSALLEAVCAEAGERGYGAVTLTTFRDVPWNAPWYAARGFAVLPERNWGPQLRAQWRTEIEAGIAVAPRVAMDRTAGSSMPPV